MIKRCVECGKLATTEFKIQVDGEEQVLPLLCTYCKSHLVGEIKRLLDKAKSKNKEVKIIANLQY